MLFIGNLLTKIGGCTNNKSESEIIIWALKNSDFLFLKQYIVLV